MRARQRRIGRQIGGLDLVGPPLEIAGDMLAGDGIAARMGGEPVQRLAGEHVYAFMGAEHAGFELHEIRAGAGQAVDQIVDQIRIDQRRVAGDPQQGAGAGLQRRQPVALQHILQRPAHTDHADFGAKLLDGVVTRVDGCRDRHRIHGAALIQAVDDVPEQRLARDRHQHLAGQARGPHARLDDGDDGARHPRTRHQGDQLWRTCRKGRKPSAGSARHSRSGNSAGTGSLKPLPSAVTAWRMRRMTGAISSGSQQ